MICLIFLSLFLIVLLLVNAANMVRVVFLIGVTICIFSSCTQTDKKPKVQQTPATKPSMQDSLTAYLDTLPNWVYTDEEDRMSSKKKYFATCISKDLLEFPFPYDGGSVAVLIVGSQANKNYVVLRVTKGQFSPSLLSKPIRIRFDSGEPQKYEYRDANNGLAEMIFIHNADKIISNIKKSKRIIIEAQFFKGGVKTMEFDVEGLKWEY